MNEANNTFNLTNVKTYCKNNGEESSVDIDGYWVNPEIIPDSLSFELEFKDGKKFSCSFKKDSPQEIACPNARGIIHSSIKDQFMDEKQEYYLLGNDYGINFDCSSLYIYINLLLLFIILFILF